MCEFEKGQIVYVKNEREEWRLSHFVAYATNVALTDKNFIVNDLYNEVFTPGYVNDLVDQCLSVEDYHKMLKQPKDRDLVWAWGGYMRYERAVRFYDAHTGCTFSSITGNRGGAIYDNYEVIPREQWPEWAIKAYELLED